MLAYSKKFARKKQHCWLILMEARDKTLLAQTNTALDISISVITILLATGIN